MAIMMVIVQMICDIGSPPAHLKLSEKESAAGKRGRTAVSHFCAERPLSRVLRKLRFDPFFLDESETAMLQ